MCPMSPKGSLGSRIFLSHASSCAAATSPAGAALSVGGAVAAGVWPPAPFMISATPQRPTDRPAYLLLHTSLFGLSSLLPCRSVRPRPAQEPVHPPGTTDGRATGD